jgi:hydrogenase maturation protease
MKFSATDRHPVTVIGYGNTFCRDDGVGPAVVTELEERFKDDPRVRFVVTRQLTPEVAMELDASRVVLIDASVALAPGAVSVRRVHAVEGARSMTHHVGDGYVLGLASALFGHVPQAVSVAVGGCDFDAGEGLTPEVRKAADEVVGRLSRYIRGVVDHERA